MENKITSRIKRLAKEKNVSIKQMLSDCGVNKNFIYDVEHTSAAPSLSKLLPIANYFNVSVDFILGNTETKSKPVVEDDELYDRNEKIKIILAKAQQLSPKGQTEAMKSLDYLLFQEGK